MPKYLPPLNSLKAFEASAKYLNFTKAAESLFVTQAAISHQIKLLEEYLGFSLFYRNNRALALTELGAVYFESIRDILAKLSDVTEKVRLQNQQNNIIISAPYSLSLHWLIPLLNEFNRQFPDIEVHLLGDDPNSKTIRYNADLSIHYGFAQSDNLSMTPFYKGKLFILGSPKLLEKSPVLCAQCLKKHTLIHINTYENWQKMFSHLRLDPEYLLQRPLFSHSFMGVQAAIHGQGLILVNDLLAQQSVERGDLKIAFDVSIPDPKSFYLVHENGNASKPSVMAFQEWILEKIKG